MPIGEPAPTVTSAAEGPSGRGSRAGRGNPPGRGATPGDAVTATIDAALRDSGLTFEQVEPGAFSVELPGEQRLKTTCWLTVGWHSLAVEAFVMRRPDENREAVYRHLLQRNSRTYVVSWSVDELGDVYLSGRLPLTAVTGDEIDRVLGSVLSNADDGFNTLLELGFGAAIRREWDWRAKNGESLRNLDAFAEFVARARRGDGADPH